jgi:hypothetical protein
VTCMHALLLDECAAHLPRNIKNIAKCIFSKYQYGRVIITKTRKMQGSRGGVIPGSPSLPLATRRIIKTLLFFLRQPCHSPYY